MRSLSLMFLMLAFDALAGTKITTQIHEIDHGTKRGDEILIFLKSGDVARIKHSDQKILKQLGSDHVSNQWFQLTLDDHRVITSVKVVEPKLRVKYGSDLTPPEANYVPTTVASMEIATQYISEGRIPVKEETQCFNRAMVWVYEWWRNHSLRSNKVFIFWPKEYVRRYSFKWWFHVSPYVHVKDTDGVVRERVMDVKWLRKPYEFQKWADYHSSHDVKCKVVNKYSEYADHPFESDRCYFIRADMYTWMPADLEMKEAWGYRKEAFNMDEVRNAYLEAFDIYL